MTQEMILWIIVAEGRLSCAEKFSTAVKTFESLESFLVNDSKVIKLEYNAKESTFSIEEVPLKTIASEMMGIKQK